MASKSLAARLLEVRRAVPAVQKDDKNAHHGYRFASSEAVLGAVRAAMDTAGIILVPSVIRAERGTIATKSGEQVFTEIWLRYWIVNADDQTDRMEIEWYGQGIDSGERGVGKALTYGEKYLILKLFQLPTTEDDPDSERRDAVDHQAQRAPAPKAEQPRPVASDKNPASDKQKSMIFAIATKKSNGMARDDVVAVLQTLCRRDVGVELDAMTARDASRMIDIVQAISERDFAATEVAR